MRSWIFLSIITCLLGSCVSSKKYKSLAQKNQEANAKLRQQQLDVSKQAQVCDSLNAVLNAERISQKKTQDSLLALLQTVRDSVLGQSELALQLRDSLNLIQQQYSVLRNSSSREVRELIRSLEAMQKDLLAREQRLKIAEKDLKARDAANEQLRKSLAEVLLGMGNPNESPNIQVKNGRVYVTLSNQLLFPSASARLDKNGKRALREIAKVLNKQKDWLISVEGHTDDQMVKNIDCVEDNWDLSVFRATAVIRFLTDECQVSPKRLVATGRASYLPKNSASTPEARSQNRRTELILIPKLDVLYQQLKPND
ncbi:MAG: OmpA family protein [Bacteroidia bacterium]|nr:OmpA family protein [Bacteroidia bacterium]